jgi:hypothetical protein
MSLFSRVRLFLGTSEGYNPILRAGYILIAASLLALSQLGPEMVKLENESYKIKYEIEYAAKKPIEAIECGTMGTNEPLCRLAQHQIKTLRLSLELWAKFIRWSANLGITLLAVGLLGWLMPLLGYSGAKRGEA